ncbi:protein FAM241B [Protopterus annectens]|uniref:protein FAM241B n=1 Tax=Protopterus annectens TaxID=7888 RepID=UPI001CFB28C1|nr:protein FAM241B [Protopterus annectens]XP_043912560.1 protein FAM241B [Protopterus annectens]
MVRILANGEIVPDDDPRVRNRAQQNENRNTFGQGFSGQPENAQYHPQNQMQDSPFSALNQRLSEVGIPRWNLGNWVIEPAVSILLLLVVIMMGMRGILLLGLLYVLSRINQ